jgi:hypothetical protein
MPSLPVSDHFIEINEMIEIGKGAASNRRSGVLALRLLSVFIRVHPWLKKMLGGSLHPRAFALKALPFGCSQRFRVVRVFRG